MYNSCIEVSPNKFGITTTEWYEIFGDSKICMAVGNGNAYMSYNTVKENTLSAINLSCKAKGRRFFAIISP